MTDSRHFADELQMLADGQLDAATTLIVKSHLQSCAQCRGEFAGLQAFKGVLRGVERPAPSEALWSQIQAALDTVPAPSKLTATPVSHWRSWRLAAVVLLFLVGAAWVWRTMIIHDAIAEVASTATQFDAGALTLDVSITVPAQLEQYFRDQGIRFATRVLDLTMMRYGLLGGSRREVDGTTSALFAYRGPAGELVLCEMFVAPISHVTKGAERREQGGISFFVHHRGKLTLVFWAEGDVICVLASSADRESVIALAMAKAMKVG